MTDKTKGSKTPVAPTPKKTEVKPVVSPAQPKVTIQPAKEVKIRNPYLTLRISIPGLPLYEKDGVGTRIMKTGRAWIRERNLSVTMSGVETQDIEGQGNTIEIDGSNVKCDLKHIIFSKQCIQDSGKTVTPVRSKSQRAPAKTKGDASKPKADKPATKPVETKPVETKPVVPAADKAKVPSDW